MDGKNRGNPIRPLCRRVVIAKDISLVSPSEDTKIVLQQSRKVSTLSKKEHHFTNLFQKIGVFRAKTAKSQELTARETRFPMTRMLVGVGFFVVNSADVIISTVKRDVEEGGLSVGDCV